MHVQVLQWVEQAIRESGTRVSDVKILEFGSLDINGSVRSLFTNKNITYVGVDMQAGPGVDVVADAATYDSELLFDIIICCEVFEHCQNWREIVVNSHRLLTPGGIFIATMAGEGRRPHSAIDENPIREWEYYANVGAWELGRCIKGLFTSYSIDYIGSDLRCSAIK